MRIAQYLTIAVTLGACGKDASAPAPGGAPGKPVEVGVITVKTEPLTLTKELPGRTSAFRVAEVRARVNGIVLKRLFTEGADVKEGQALFKIDPAPYQAAVESAQPQLTRAEANVESAQSLGERYTVLIESNAVSRQEYDDAMAKVKLSVPLFTGGRNAANLDAESFLSVLLAQQDLYVTQQRLIEVRFERMTNLAQLHTALGGGWRER